MDLFDLATRLAVGMGLAALLGIEREASGKAAGLRTYAMVGLGAAIFTVLSETSFPEADTSRVASQVVTGVGFLGAGAIFRSGPLVKGLTTAAGLWAAAAVGMAAGTGQLLWATVATGLGILILVGLRALDPVIHLFRRTKTVETIVSPTDEFLHVREAVGEIDPEVDLVGVRHEDDDTVILTFDVHPHEVDLLRGALEAMTAVKSTRVKD